MEDLLEPRETLVIFDVIARHPELQPTRAIRALSIGKSTWYRATDKLERWGLIYRALSEKGGGAERFSMTRDGWGAFRAMQAFTESLQASGPGLEWQLEEAMARGDLARISTLMFAIARFRTLRRDVEGVDQALAQLRLLGLENVASMLDAVELLARGSVAAAMELRPCFDASLPGRDLPIVGPLGIYTKARLLEAQGDLGGSSSLLRQLNSTKPSEHLELLWADAAQSGARLALKAGNVSKAIEGADAVWSLYFQLRDGLARAEAALVGLTARMMRGDRMDVHAHFVVTWTMVREGGFAGPILEWMALRRIDALQRGQRGEARKQAAAMARLPSPLDHSRQTRLRALAAVAVDLEGRSSEAPPTTIREMLRAAVAGAP